MVEVLSPNVMLSGLKKAEDSNNLVVRLYEFGGKDTKAYKTADVDDDKVGRQSWTQLRED